MAKKLILGTLLGGLILFAWSAVSWELLSWHTSSFKRFSNEEAFTEALIAGAKMPGMYSIPGDFEGQANMEKLMQGPFMFAVVRPGAMGPAAPMFLGQILIQLGTAFLATLLLMQVRGGYSGRVLFAAGMGLAGGIAAFAPEMNWWGFAPIYTLVNVADMVIGFGLAGLALAKITATGPRDVPLGSR